MQTTRAATDTFVCDAGGPSRLEHMAGMAREDRAYETQRQQSSRFITKTGPPSQ